MSCDFIVHSLKKINFIKRYQFLCSQYNDFDNRLRGKHKLLYDKVLNELGINFNYEAKEKFYRIKSDASNSSVDLGLKLHDGLVECFLYCIQNDEWIFHGRFDFIAEQLDVNYDRKNYNLLKYTNADELRNILLEISAIYHDFKADLLQV